MKEFEKNVIYYELEALSWSMGDGYTSARFALSQRIIYSIRRGIRNDLGVDKLGTTVGK